MRRAVDPPRFSYLIVSELERRMAKAWTVGPSALPDQTRRDVNVVDVSPVVRCPLLRLRHHAASPRDHVREPIVRRWWRRDPSPRFDAANSIARS